MWFPVFCECFALCLLFNSCLHTQRFITYGCLMKTFLSCFWPQAFTTCFNPPFKQLLHMLAHCCPWRATAGVWYSSWGGNWGGRQLIPPVRRQTHPKENFYRPCGELPAPGVSYSKMQPFARGKKVTMDVFFFSSVLYMQWVSVHDTQRPFTFVLGVAFLFSLPKFLTWVHRVLKRPKPTRKINSYAPFLLHLNLQNKGHVGFNYCLWRVLSLCK